MTTQPFLIFALPRSLTAWTSCALTVGNCFCMHEMPFETKDVLQYFENSPFAFTGVADSSLLLRWKEITQGLPTARLIYVRRPNYQSQNALARVADIDPRVLEDRYQALSQAADQFIQHCEPRILDASKLATRNGLCELWEAATGLAPESVPALHAAKMLSLHIEQKPEIIQQACASGGRTTKN